MLLLVRIPLLRNNKTVARRRLLLASLNLMQFYRSIILEFQTRPDRHGHGRRRVLSECTYIGLRMERDHNRTFKLLAVLR